MNVIYKNEKRLAGIKAKRFMDESDSDHTKQKNMLDLAPIVLIISPWYNRIAMVLRSITVRAGKFLDLEGVDLYRKALGRLHSESGDRVAALIITDRPDDYGVAGTNEFPIWKECIINYQQNYIQNFAKEIGDDILPASLTVVTMFADHKGKLAAEEIEQMEEEFSQLQQDAQFNRIHCENEEELKEAVNKEVVDVVLKRQRQKENVKKFERNRQQKISKAKTVTKSAHQRLLYGKE